MDLIADEHIPPEVVKTLRDAGYDVLTIDRALELSAEDSEIHDYAQQTNRVILTNDRDFLEFDAHPGVLLCDVLARPGQIVSAIQRIDAASANLNGTVLRVPGTWE
jgi:predicted nuclease of predicted toxin-antitoxin system